MTEAVMTEAQWLERLEESEALLEEYPDHPDAGRLAGEALVELRRRGEGIVQLREQTVRCPHDSLAHDLLADALIIQGRAAEALEATELALAARPGRPQATYDRARASSLLGRDESALLDLALAMKADRCFGDRAHEERAFRSLATDARFRALFSTSP